MELAGMVHFLVACLVVIILFFLTMAVRVMKEYERAVVLRLGRFCGIKGPGPVFVIPIMDKLLRVDMRTNPMDVPRQEVVTKDNVSIVVDAVLYYRVIDPQKAILEVNNYIEASFLIAQTTLRSILGQMELDEILAKREEVNRSLHKIIDEQTDPWGIQVLMVELKELVLPEEMKRAMARQAEMERERRAMVISAEGEYQASHKLKEAAQVIGSDSVAVQLRYLQTLADIAVGKSSTIVFPMPLDIFDKLFSKKT